MPYVDSMSRKALDDGMPPRSAGELNYVITQLVVSYLRRGVPGGTMAHHRGIPLHELEGMTYANLNEVVGVLESAKAEFQRRVVAPFEDTKIEQNGDVYQ